MKRLISIVGAGLFISLVGMLEPVSAYNEIQLKKFLALGDDCSNCDLSGADLRGKLLPERDLANADLTGADLTEVVLRWAVLNKANPQNLDLLVLPELAFSGTLLHDISWISLAVSAVSRMSEHHLDRNIYSELRVSTCTVIQISNKL